MVVALAMAGVVVFGSQQAMGQPAPVEQLTFREAVDRAVTKNPTAAIAAAGILRAAAVIDQARSASRLQVNGNAVSTTLNRGVKFEDTTVTPQTSLTAGLDV